MDQYERDYNINCVKLTKHIRKKLFKALGPIKEKKSNESGDSSGEIGQEPGLLNRKEINPFSIFPHGSHPSESQQHSKPTKNFVAFGKKGKAKKVIKPATDLRKSVNVFMYARTYIGALVSLTFKLGKFAALYGTELIIQVLAMSTIAVVMALKFLDIFVRNRYLASVISYIEKVDFSTLRFPVFSMDFMRLFFGFRHILWIMSKLLEFVWIIFKHFMIQSIIGIFFLFSWMTYSVGLLVSNFFLRPVVNKTMNILHMDGETLANIAKFKVDNVLRIVINLTFNIAPLLKDAIIEFGNMRHNIVKISMIRGGILDFLAGIRAFITTIVELFNDVSSMFRLFLDLHEMLLSIVVLLCNTLSLIGFMVYIIFQMMEYAGYVLGIFIRVFTSSSKALSRLQKI